MLAELEGAAVYRVKACERHRSLMAGSFAPTGVGLLCGTA